MKNTEYTFITTPAPMGFVNPATYLVDPNKKKAVAKRLISLLTSPWQISEYRNYKEA